jgi:(E)-4-hydroxy-3-methylbut-2-enyl-diphosphate synthase
MGCIVNGVGEMADADFGYVGGAPGKVYTLIYIFNILTYNIPLHYTVITVHQIVSK